MEANFNNGRKHLRNNYNALVNLLVANAEGGVDINISVDLIKGRLNDLRSDIVGLCCMYDTENGYEEIDGPFLHLEEMLEDEE